MSEQTVVGLEQLEQALYEHIRGTSRHSRYFNLMWFKTCRQSAFRNMNLGTCVKEILDPTVYRITPKKDGKRIHYKFYLMDNGLYHLHRTITVNKDSHNILNVKKKDAIRDPFVYATAVIMEYLKLPRNWKTLGIVGKNKSKTFTLREHKEKKEMILQITDHFYNRIQCHEGDLEILESFFNKIRSLRNLKPFFQISKLELGLIALRLVRKRRRRRKREVKYSI